MTKRHLLFLPLIAVLVMLVLSACAAPPPRENSARRSPAPTVSPAILMNDDRPPQLQRLTESWNTDWTRHTIRYDEILSGGPPRDGIPAIDDPKFVTIDAAAGWLQEQEPVVALAVNGVARAYPLHILTWHEIVNDQIDDTPVAVTFCPLCNSAVVFDRRRGGQTLDFGVSGLLRNSDLIMYDRQTESLWQQFTGEGIVGEMAGQMLTWLPASIISFADFRQAYPAGQVLSRDTGYPRSYGNNPYVGYDNIDQSPFLFEDIPDETPGQEPASPFEDVQEDETAAERAPREDIIENVEFRGARRISSTGGPTIKPSCTTATGAPWN